MKAKIFKVAVMVVFAFITGLNFYKAKTEVKLSDAQLKNVEALATSEYEIGSDEYLKTFCFKKDNDECHEFNFSLNGNDYGVSWPNWTNKNVVVP